MTLFRTCGFSLPGVADDPTDLAQSTNHIPGAAVLRAVRPLLTRHGWPFGEPFAEDFGWFTDCRVDVDGKPVKVALAAAPDADAEDARDGSAWRIITSMDDGLLPSTRRSRREQMARLAQDLEASLTTIGATGLIWDEDGSGD